MNKGKHTKEVEARLEAAARWNSVVNSDNSSEEDWLAFTDWLEADVANAIAYDEIETLTEFTHDHSNVLKQTFASETSDTENVIALPINIKRRPHSHKYWAAFIAIAATFIFATLGPWHLFFSAPQMQEYVSNQPGGRVLTLDDGTRIHLNVNSKLSVLMTAKTRQTVLLYGEAVFDVAKDNKRPFYVDAGENSIRVLGTKFNVLNHHGTVTITVSEGVVNVETNLKTVSELVPDQRLTVGKQLHHSQGSRFNIIADVDADTILAWRQGQLIYSEKPLGEIVTDLNRYFINQIKLDPAVGDYIFTGVLNTDDQEVILELLAASLPIELQRTGDTIRLIAK